jgi:hypothetical protein
MPASWAPPTPQHIASFVVLGTLPLRSVSDSLTFGLPWLARASEEEEEALDDGWSSELLSASPGAPSNASLFSALCQSLAETDTGLLLAANFSLDSGAQGRDSPFRCFYIALPPTSAQGASAGDSGEELLPAGALLLKRIAAKEEMLPRASAAPAGIRVASSLKQEVADALAGLPSREPYEALAHEQGVQKIVGSLVQRSLPLPLPVPPSGKASKRKTK